MLLPLGGGRPKHLGQRMAVVWAGVVGAAVAPELAVRRADVWLLDKDDRVEGTTAISWAWLNAHAKREPAYPRLNVAGMAEQPRLSRASVRSGGGISRPGISSTPATRRTPPRWRKEFGRA